MTLLNEKEKDFLILLMKNLSGSQTIYDEFIFEQKEYEEIELPEILKLKLSDGLIFTNCFRIVRRNLL